MASSVDENPTVSEEVKILKNEAEWAEKQQLQNEQEIIRLKTVIQQLSEELQKTHLQVTTHEYQEHKLKLSLENKEKECQNVQSELNITTNELYKFKTKVSLLSNRVLNLQEQFSELGNEKDLVLKDYENIKKQLEEKNEEGIRLQETALKSADIIQSLEYEMLALADSNSRFKAEVANQKQDFLNRQTALEEQEQRLNNLTFASKQSKLLEEEITRLHASNKDLRSKLSQKNSGLPIVFLSQANKTMSHQNIKNTVRSLEEKVEELHKQLILAQSKICTLEQEMQQCGRRPAKRNFLQHTLSSQSKQRVPFTSGKENANAQSPTHQLFNPGPSST